MAVTEIKRRWGRADESARDWFQRIDERPWLRFVVSGATLFGQRRIFGLSAEGAFWATFTLPWLVLGVLAATSGVAQWFGDDVSEQVRASIVDAASQVLTQQAIDETLVPLLNRMAEGSTGLSILGFVVALWSGSRVFATFVAGSEILNGRPPRGWVKTRAIALGIYVLGLAALGVVVVTLFQFPDFWANLAGLAPGPTTIWGVALGGLGMIVALTTVLYLADPTSTSWGQHLPGGVLALAVWVLASGGLSLYFQFVVSEESFYGAVAAPIAIMTWLFVTVLALFVGMTLSATGRLAQHDEFLDPFEPVEATYPTAGMGSVSDSVGSPDSAVR